MGKARAIEEIAKVSVLLSHHPRLIFSWPCETRSALGRRFGLSALCQKRPEKCSPCSCCQIVSLYSFWQVLQPTTGPVVLPGQFFAGVKCKQPLRFLFPFW
jgi:hypothetical protein